MDWLHKGSRRLESTGAEQGCGGQNIVDISRSEGHQELKQIQ